MRSCHVAPLGGVRRGTRSALGFRVRWVSDPVKKGTLTATASLRWLRSLLRGWLAPACTASPGRTRDENTPLGGVI